MNCIFNIGSCSLECPKYLMCMYNSTQNQLSEINQQLNFILNLLAELSCEVGINKEKLNIVNNDVQRLYIKINNLSDNDSESNNNKSKES